MLKIRNFKVGDEPFLWQLFFNTVRTINIKDYSKQQVNAWASETCSPEEWSLRIQGINPFIAEIDGKIAGYADLQDDGYIDHFFCHHEYQGKGIGSALMRHLIKVGKAKQVDRFYSQVSITARPFFEKHGFHIVKQQTVEMRGEQLNNYLMERPVQ